MTRTTIVLMILWMAAPVMPASAEPTTCEIAIVKAGAIFAQTTAAALHACRAAVLKGKLAENTNCVVEPKNVARITKARERLARTITKACGGRDATCGTVDDDPLAAIGWAIGTCPGYREAGCTGPITDCSDIPGCIECIVQGAVRQATSILYTPITGDLDTNVEKRRRSCVLAIGKAAQALLVAKSKALAKCWSAVKKGKIPGPCPFPGDGRAQVKVEAARASFVAKVCKACGGKDGCGGAEDHSPMTIGFPSTCPTIGACGGANTTLQNLAACTDCLTGIAGDCADRAGVRRFGYPTPCKAVPTPSPTPNPQPTLNYSLPPVYGSTALTSGFVPDPFSVGITAGGPANANYLGGGCYGYTTAAPSFSVNYTSGAFPTLRFYFIGSGDTTMIINSPSGSYFCVDDSFGTLNPTIDFNSPSSGRYDVWVATYASGASIGGTLYVTENTGNHP